LSFGREGIKSGVNSQAQGKAKTRGEKHSNNLLK